MGASIRGDFTTTIFMVYSLYVCEINCSCADYDKRFYDHQHRAGQKVGQQDARAKGKGDISGWSANTSYCTHNKNPFRHSLITEYDERENMWEFDTVFDIPCALNNRTNGRSLAAATRCYFLSHAWMFFSIPWSSRKLSWRLWGILPSFTASSTAHPSSFVWVHFVYRHSPR